MLMGMFNTIGRVKSAKVMVDIKTGKSRGFGFVKFENSRDGIILFAFFTKHILSSDSSL